jgi:hypothetical protein
MISLKILYALMYTVIFLLNAFFMYINSGVNYLRQKIEKWKYAAHMAVEDKDNAIAENNLRYILLILLILFL